MFTFPQSVVDIITNLRKRFPSWDSVMVFDTFLFFFSFWILQFEKDGDKNFAARSWLWYVNALFMIDLFFRLLSIRIESIKREYWNHTLPCIFTLILWLSAAFYDFNEVFGSKPTQGFNIFLFIVYHLCLGVYMIQNLTSSEYNQGQPRVQNNQQELQV